MHDAFWKRHIHVHIYNTLGMIIIIHNYTCTCTCTCTCVHVQNHVYTQYAESTLVEVRQHCVIFIYHNYAFSAITMLLLHCSPFSGLFNNLSTIMIMLMIWILACTCILFQSWLDSHSGNSRWEVTYKSSYSNPAAETTWEWDRR